MCRRRRGDVRETQWSGIGRLMEHITGSREWSHDVKVWDELIYPAD